MNAGRRRRALHVFRHLACVGAAVDLDRVPPASAGRSLPALQSRRRPTRRTGLAVVVIVLVLSFLLLTFCVHSTVQRRREGDAVIADYASGAAIPRRHHFMVLVSIIGSRLDAAAITAVGVLICGAALLFNRRPARCLYRHCAGGVSQHFPKRRPRRAHSRSGTHFLWGLAHTALRQ